MFKAISTSTVFLLRTLLILFVLPLCFVACAGAQGAPYTRDNLLLDRCYSQKLLQDNPAAEQGLVSADLGWVMSFFWRNNEELLFIDPAFGQISRAPLGQPMALPLKRMDENIGSNSEDAKFNFPATGCSLSDDQGFLLLDRRQDGSLIHTFDQNFKVTQKTIEAVPHKLDDGWETTGIWGISPLAGKGILAFADVRKERGSKKPLEESSFVYLSSQESLSSLRLGTPVSGFLREFFHHNFSYMASLDDDVFVLMLDEQPWVGKINLDAPREISLVGKIEGYRIPDTVQHFDKGMSRKGREAALKRQLRFFQTIEDSRLPAGLFTLENKLFILLKSEMDRYQKTEWRLVEMDVQTGKLKASSWRLPTDAAQVNVLPGKHLAILERGPVRTLGGDHPDYRNNLYRQTRRLKFTPSNWLDSTHRQDMLASTGLGSDCEDISPFR